MGTALKKESEAGFPGWYIELQAAVLRQLPRPGQIDRDVGKVWIDDQSGLHQQLCQALSGPCMLPIVPNSAPPKRNPYLKKVVTATIAPAKGTVTLAQAGDVFSRHLDRDFTNWGTNSAGVDTEAALADVYTMEKQNGTYAEIFGSLVGASGSYDKIATVCRPLCWQQGQIVEFARTHRALLRQDGYATFFLFEVNGELFVASVRVVGGMLGAYVGRFSRTNVWGADNHYRVVVPQQKL